MRQLSEPLVIHGVDVEEVCAQVEQRFLRSSGATLSLHDREDLRAYLIEQAWAIAERFEPARDKRGVAGFYTFAARLLDGRLVDWVRVRAGDGRYPKLLEAKRNVSQPLSLDAPIGDGNVLDGDNRPELLGAVIPDGQGDPAEGRGPLCDGLLGGGDRNFARDLALVRRRAALLARRRAEADKRRSRERVLSRQAG